MRNREDNSMDTKLKKGQQEIMGFIIIVVMVVIIGVILLGIYLRKDKPIEKTDAEISNFLSASLRYTTECTRGTEESYQNLGDLVKACYSRRTLNCLSGLDACQETSRVYGQLINSLWPAGANRPVRASKMSFFYVQNLSEEGRTSFLESVSQGNRTGCYSIKSGVTLLSADSGDILLDFELCLGN